jgi:hypothetical protein
MAVPGRFVALSSDTLQSLASLVRADSSHVTRTTQKLSYETKREQERLRTSTTAAPVIAAILLLCASLDLLL